MWFNNEVIYPFVDGKTYTISYNPTAVTQEKQKYERTKNLSFEPLPPWVKLRFQQSFWRISFSILGKRRVKSKNDLIPVHLPLQCPEMPCKIVTCKTPVHRAWPSESFVLMFKMSIPSMLFRVSRFFFRNWPHLQDPWGSARKPQQWGSKWKETLMKGSDFIGNYLFCPLRESLHSTMATTPGRQQRYKGANQNTVRTFSLLCRVHERRK